MFRKIVSSLAFSPALVGQLNYYAKQMRKETSRRRIGLIFIALAVIIQLFAVFYPPEASNSANVDNIIYSGIQNRDDLLRIYDRGTDGAGNTDIKQIYTHFNISRDDIVNSTMGSYKTTDFDNNLQSIGRSDWGVAYRTPVFIPGTSTTIYSGLHKDGPAATATIPALIGNRSVDKQWFAIPLDYGGIVYAVPPPSLASVQNTCGDVASASRPIDGVVITTNRTPSQKITCGDCSVGDKTQKQNERCTSYFELTKQVKNVTQSIDDAHMTTAQPGDLLQYILSVKNVSTTPAEYTIRDSMNDVLEYARIVTIGDGSLSTKNPVSPTSIEWPTTTIKPNEKLDKVVVVKINDSIPATATHLLNVESYNCKLTNTFGNTLAIRVACPPEKSIETIISELPPTSRTTNVLFATLLVISAYYFYARSRQLSTELRIIRRDLHDGTI